MQTSEQVKIPSKTIGVFIVPGLLLQLVGSVGMALTLFVIGGVSCFLATWTYVELGLMNPVSGGDKEYLDLAFPYPKALFSFLLCQVRVWMINPGQVAAVSVAAGKFFLEGLCGARGVIDKSTVLYQNYDYIARGISCIMVISIMIMHTFMPKKAITVQDSMVVVKAALLFGGIIIGIVALCGGTAVKPSGNLNNLFEGTILDINPLASAFLKVLFVYDGWSTLNYALSEVIEPKKNFPISAFTAITISSLLFNFFSLMMFAVVPKASILNPDMGFISSQFFTLTLGPLVGSKILPFAISLSAYSCAMCNVFTGSRLLFEAAREGFLPFSTHFSAISSFESPANALLHIGSLSIFYIIVPPPGKAYEFLSTNFFNLSRSRNLSSSPILRPSRNRLSPHALHPSRNSPPNQINMDREYCLHIHCCCTCYSTIHPTSYIRRYTLLAFSSVRFSIYITICTLLLSKGSCWKVYGYKL